jgi:hypothetical protein
MKRAQIEQASIAWVVFWGLIALDSAVTYRRSVQAVERAVDADPVAEMYDGPPDPDAQVKRWLLWRSPTLVRLRKLTRRAQMLKETAPWIAIVGPPLFFALGLRRREHEPA